MAKISVCIPTYNGADYLHECLVSVLSQTFDDFELIIVDDSSGDSTQDIIASFQDKRIRFFVNPVNLGLVGNWNRCLELSSAKYIYIFHQDDVMMSNNLALKYHLLESSPNVGLVHSNVLPIDANGNEIKSQSPELTPKPKSNTIDSGTTYFETIFVNVGSPISCPSVMVRRECYEELGVYDPRLPFTCDVEMWLRIVAHYDIAYLSDPLIKYRWHKSNETNKYYANVNGYHQIYMAKKIAITRNLSRIPAAKNMETVMLRKLSERVLRYADFKWDSDHEEALRLLRYALNLSPTLMLTSRGFRLLSKRISGDYGVRMVRLIKKILYS